MGGALPRFTALGVCILGLTACATPSVTVAPITITTNNINNNVVTTTTMVTRRDSPGSCLYKLEFDDPNDHVRFITEIGGNRGPAQRIDSCLAFPPAFASTPSSNAQWFDEQSAYYWLKKSRDYAVSSLWSTPPGWTGPPPKFANAQVDANVLQNTNDATGFKTACAPREPNGCMRFWPGTVPKIFIPIGSSTASVVGHEFGHYATGFVFGHMDIGVDGFDIASCSHRSFQEATAETFFQLLRHHELTSVGGTVPIPGGITGLDSQWRNECTVDEYPMAAPVWEAFTQSVWGRKDATGGPLVVPWPNPAAANRAMANAFTFALATTKGLRHYLLAQAALDHVAKNQPANIAAMVRAIFAAHGLLPIQNGLYCAENAECASNYCDRGDGTSKSSLCMPAPSSGTTKQPCTNDNQCESSHCSGLARGVDGAWIPGHCEAPVFIGQPCATNSQCATRYCDRGDGTSHTGLCMKGDGTATEGEPCSNNNQCISLNCAGLTTDAAGKWIPGRCAAKAALGQFCRQDLDCASGDCDVDEGDAGSMMCTPPNATGRTNDLCTQHSQCASGLCVLLSTGANGLPIPGRCGTTGGDIGATCTGNAECTSGYCDRGDGTSKTSLCLPSRGTGPLGTLCSHDNQCASGICGGLTQNSSSNWIPGRCAVAGPLGAACSNNQQCASGYCDAGWGTSKTNRCMPLGATGTTGQLCSNDNQCASSNCSGLAQNTAGEWVPGTCGAKLGLGMTCYANYLCSSGYCDRGDGTSKTSKCMPAAGAGTIGQTCSHDNQCATANCAGLRQDSYYNWLPGNCAAQRMLGDMCTTNGQCASTYCDAGDGTSKTSQCMPRGRTGTPGQICSHNNQCVSGTCSGLTPNPNGTWTPGSCL